MALYVFLGKLTREGRMRIKETPPSASATMQFATQLGLKVIDYYATLGAYDYVSIMEGPDDPAPYFKIVALGSMDGTVEWVTLPAMRNEDARRLLQELPALPKSGS